MSKRRQRWTASYAAAILDKADRAKSDRAYAARRGISGQRLTWWRRRLDRPRRRTRGPGVSFVEVKARPSATPAPVVEVLLINGRQLRVSERADATVIARLADALEGRC